MKKTRILLTLSLLIGSVLCYSCDSPISSNSSVSSISESISASEEESSENTPSSEVSSIIDSPSSEPQPSDSISISASKLNGSITFYSMNDTHGASRNLLLPLSRVWLNYGL